jgi:hypothetical protein
MKKQQAINPAPRIRPPMEQLPASKGFELQIAKASQLKPNFPYNPNKNK